jgi:hypothetical protein
MKNFLNSMIGYWFLLLFVSLILAYFIYQTWLKDVV